MYITEILHDFSFGDLERSLYHYEGNLFDSDSLKINCYRLQLPFRNALVFLWFMFLEESFRAHSFIHFTFQLFLYLFFPEGGMVRLWFLLQFSWSFTFWRMTQYCFVLLFGIGFSFMKKHFTLFWLMIYCLLLRNYVSG